MSISRHLKPEADGLRVRNSVRIGGGAGFASDRIDALGPLIRNGSVDYIILEMLAERTLAILQGAQEIGRDGFFPSLLHRLDRYLPECLDKGIGIITNGGGVDPLGAAKRIAETRSRRDIPCRIGVVTGDDVRAAILRDDVMIPEYGVRLSEIGRGCISAHAYLGSEGIERCLADGAHVVITGRVADPALVLGPVRHALGWSPTDFDLAARGLVAGHLVECGAQATGGYFADAVNKTVPDLETVGYPIAEVHCDGRIVISKPSETGGVVDRRTVTEQLLYEVHDPSQYLTPDAVIDLSQAEVDEAQDGVHVTGIAGRPAPETLKVLVALENGYLVEGGISYHGPGALERAALAEDILRKRFKLILRGKARDIWFTRYGTGDVRLHMCARVRDTQQADILAAEVEALYTNGPAGGGGARAVVRRSLEIVSTLIPRDTVSVSVEMIDA